MVWKKFVFGSALLFSSVSAQAASLDFSWLDFSQDGSEDYYYKVQTSVWTTHFNPKPEHNNHQNLVGFEVYGKRLPEERTQRFHDAFDYARPLVGVAFFRNSFHQNTTYLYGGVRQNLVPIEPAFLLAVDRDPELIKLALDQHIMLVSPTNLLVALRTVNNIWQYEQQNQNAQRIAQDAARLYDKFANFVEDLQKIGQSLEGTRKHWDAAMNKLSTGRGNLLGRVEKFRELGVQPAKQIDRNLLADDDSTSSDESER